MDKLGEKMILAAFTVKGDFSKIEGTVEVTNKIIETIGMNKAQGAVVCTYPYEGKGGNGHTYFQPITESFLVWDAWPDLQGAYLVICSCKMFWIQDVSRVLREAGLRVVEHKIEGMNL